MLFLDPGVSKRSGLFRQAVVRIQDAWSVLKPMQNPENDVLVLTINLSDDFKAYRSSVLQPGSLCWCWAISRGSGSNAKEMV